MEAVRKKDWPRTVAEFEAWQVRRPERWEFIAGQPRLTAPASMRRTIIKGNAFRALDRALAGSGCEVLISGAQILTDDISAIPDIVVTRAPLDHSTPAIAEPVIVVEVMSPSGEVDDTGRKWLSCRKIASLRHYVVVSQTERLVHVHSRGGELWHERFVSAGAVELDDPPVVLEIEALYASTNIAA